MTGEIGRKKPTRAKLSAYFAELEPVRIVMEACGSAHHWARVFTGLGHQVELLPAAQHGDIRRALQQSVQQQAVLALHRTRSHWVSVRTTTVDSLRGLLYDSGVVLRGDGKAGLKALTEQRTAIDEQIPAPMRTLLARRPMNVAVVALAKKMARTAGALVAHGRTYQRAWQSARPGSAAARAAGA